jgi:hypothetical protein
MTKYIFRGKRVDNGEWIYGNLSWFTDNSSVEITRVERPNGNEKWTRVVDAETVGQYVGLCDKNGNKIFEGDIVIFNRGRNLPNTIPRPLQVFFDDRNAQFTCFRSPYATLQKDQMSECEVIGNIHDNIELLEV